jgi:hypothetical protein
MSELSVLLAARSRELRGNALGGTADLIAAKQLLDELGDAGRR